MAGEQIPGRAALPAPPGPAAALAGAPLDLVKLVAACLMLGDHFNTVLLGGDVPLLWRLGRAAFPLFAFALAWHAARGLDPARYVPALLIAGLVAQPAYALAFSAPRANILFTLAIAALLAAILRRQAEWRLHASFALGVAAIFLMPVLSRTGFDFGLAGILFPAALACALSGRRAAWLWLAPLLLGLNATGGGDEGLQWRDAALDAAFAGVGGLAVLALASRLRGRPRFLPAYALHAFYPAHLLALAGLRAISG